MCTTVGYVIVISIWIIHGNNCSQFILMFVTFYYKIRLYSSVLYILPRYIFLWNLFNESININVDFNYMATLFNIVFIESMLVIHQ